MKIYSVNYSVYYSFGSVFSSSLNKETAEELELEIERTIKLHSVPNVEVIRFHGRTCTTTERYGVTKKVVLVDIPTNPSL